jgi:DNA (cytosine-5)-methyltransferase 1
MRKVLDLFCAGGGAGMGLHRAWPDAEITGVDINRQSNYPFNFVQGDALTFPLNGYDFIWASPPCQLYTRKSANWGRKRNHWIEHPDLIDPIRQRLLASVTPFVIENVVGAPIRVDLMLCGSMFGLKIQKHRNFESSFPLSALLPPCNHSDLYNPWQGKGRSADKLRAAMGIDWLPISGGASRKAGYTGDLFNAIPPAYSEYIAHQFGKVA